MMGCAKVYTSQWLNWWFFKCSKTSTCNMVWKEVKNGWNGKNPTSAAKSVRISPIPLSPTKNDICSDPENLSVDLTHPFEIAKAYRTFANKLFSICLAIESFNASGSFLCRISLSWNKIWFIKLWHFSIGHQTRFYHLAMLAFNNKLESFPCPDSEKSLGFEPVNLLSQLRWLTCVSGL